MLPILYRLLKNTASVFAAFLLIFLTTGTASAQTAPASFTFDAFHTGSSKIAGVPFSVTITAVDGTGARLYGFNSSVDIRDETGTLYPTETTNFTNGIWNGLVYVTESGANNRITATYGTASHSSEVFTVTPDTRMKFLSIYSGNNQSGTVGTLLSQALTVIVVDPYGNPIPNIGINFATISVPNNATAYSLSNTGSTTNALGQVSANFTVGRKAGTYIISAAMASSYTNNVQFYLTATPANLISLDITPKVAVMPAGSHMPFKATGFDQYLNEITLSTVTWSVQNAGGTIDATGVFYAGTTLGMFSNTIKATAGTIGATASVNVVDIWGGTSGDGSGTGDGDGDPDASPTPTPSPSPTPAPTASASATPAPSAGSLYNITIEPEVISALRNARIPIIAEGVDFFGNSVSGVNFTFEISGDLGTITQTGPNTALLTASADGIGTVTVTATQGTISRTARIVGSVGTGLNRRLVIEDIQSPQRVGEPFTISVAAKDSLNNFITDYAGPLVIADTTGTIDPATVQPSESGIWYIQAIISVAHPEVTITAAGDGMVGVSNIFSVEGDPKKEELGFGAGSGRGLGGLSDVLGASISGKIEEILKAKNLDKYAVVRYVGAGIATGLGILGASVGGGLMASKGLEAIGRNPFAKGRLQANLYVSLVAFIAVASLAVFAAMLIVK